MHLPTSPTLRSPIARLAYPLFMLVALSACQDHGSRKRSGEEESDERPKKAASSKTRASTSASATASASPNAQGLVIQLDGKPVTLKQAFIKKREGGVLQLYATSGSGSCKELLDNLFDEPPGETSILLNLKPSPGGPTTISDIFTGSRNGDLAEGAKVTLEGGADVGQSATIALDYGVRADDKEWLRVKGTLVAEGCGERPK